MEITSTIRIAMATKQKTDSKQKDKNKMKWKSFVACEWKQMLIVKRITNNEYTDAAISSSSTRST